MKQRTLVLISLGLFCGSAGLVARAASQAPAPQAPRFQASVEVTSLDVSVADDRGRPILNLGPDAFVVRIDGKPRRVMSAEWISYVSRPKTDTAVAVPEGFSTNENQTEGRIIVIAVDQPHIRTTGTHALLIAANAFIDKLSPADRVAVVGFGIAGQATALTADKQRVKDALARMTGEKGIDPAFGQYNIAISEALAITDHDLGMVSLVASRECPIPPAPGASPEAQQQAVGARMRCLYEIEGEAAILAGRAALSTSATIRGLHDLLEHLKGIDAPKTIVLISEGFVLADNEPFINEVAETAAAARATLYALQLDDESMFSVETAHRSTAPMADSRERRVGLEVLAGAARGTMYTATGSGVRFFDQLDAELSGYYLLGVESEPGDRDGRAHPIRIEVPQRKAIVRSHRQVITPADANRTPRQAVTASLRSPLLASGLTLSVATFAFGDPEPEKVQMLIHADVGKDYSDTRAVAIGYTITDQAGQVVIGWTADAQLTPRTSGTPSALQFEMSATLAPGDYTLKLAVADGRRTGSVEHPLHAALVDAGVVRLSELLVGGLVGPTVSRPPSVGALAFSSVQGYVEAYGARAGTLAVRYDIAAGPTAPTLLSADVPGRLVDPERMVFSLAMPVNRLPPGTYVLRATATAAATPLKTLARPFEVAPPARAASPGAANVILPLDPLLFMRPFRRDEALAPAALQLFRKRLAPVVKADFEAGVVSLKNGDFPKAEATLKKAIRPDVDSTAAMVYLAATFAAAGHDTEAAAAWQTALIEGGDVPQIYDWLAQSLVRSRRFSEARAILEEAIEKWPKDPRFAWPLATVYAGSGEATLAFGALERHLSARPDDRDALQVGVEWIYLAHATGRSLRAPADDLKLAHAYADAYAKAGGPQRALVARWVEFLDAEKR